MSTALVPIEQMSAMQIFNGGQVDAVLERIKSEARTEAAKLDISTEFGRKAIASLAYKVARSKTFLDDQGKKLTEDIAKQKAAVDADRKRFRDELDDLKVEVRKPLTDWEDAEHHRIEGHTIELKNMEALSTQPMRSSADVTQALETLKGFKERKWEEFEEPAQRTMKVVFYTLRETFDSMKRAEDERAELERLREEKLVQEQKERDGRIAQEAAERERKLAEAREAEAAQAAERERQRIEQEKFAAEARAKAAELKAEADRLAGIERERLAAEKAESDRIAAEAKAERDKAEAVAAEGRRIEAQRQKEKQEAEARERNKKHRGAIHADIRNSLLAFLTEKSASEGADALIEALSSGKIPHVAISY